MREQQKDMGLRDASMTEIRNSQQLLLRQVVRIVFLVAIPVLLLGSYYVWKDGKSGFIPFYIVAFVLVSVIRFWKKAPYGLQSGILLFIIYALALLALVRGGLSSNAPLFLLGFCFVAAIFLGKRAAMVSIGIAVITMGIAGALFSTGHGVIPPEVQLMNAKPTAWLSYTFILLLAAVFFVVLQTYLLQHLSAALGQSREMARQLEADREQARLEAQRKNEQAERLAWVAMLGRTLSATRQRETLAQRAVEEIAHNCDVYQVTLYFVEPSGLVLSPAATAGTLGVELFRDGGAIAIHERVAPARAAETGQEQMVFLLPGEIPHLPESRVQVSIPLNIGGEIFGVLDIHRRQSFFSEDELQIFRIIGGYVAASLDGLRLLEEAQRRLQEVRLASAQQPLASWRSALATRQTTSFTIGQVPTAQTAAAVQQAMATLQPHAVWLEDGAMYLLVVPLVAHDVALGYLAFTRAAEKGDWDADSRALIGKAAERLTVALENARLLSGARQQVLYNERLGQLSDLIWQMPNLEAIMEKSVRELGRFLDAGEVQLYLTPAPAGPGGVEHG